MILMRPKSLGCRGIHHFIALLDSPESPTAREAARLKLTNQFSP